MAHPSPQERRTPDERPAVGKPSFWIDVGGTFTDCLQPLGDQRLARCKVLSSGHVPGSIQRREGRIVYDRFRRQQAGLWNGCQVVWLGERGEELGACDVVRSEPGQLEANADIPPDAVSYILSTGEEAPILAIRLLLQLPRDAPLPSLSVRLGTTRGTNALLTRSGARCGLVTTKGFADLLAIGNQDRPRLFDLTIVKAEPLYEAVAEADERVGADGEILTALDPEPLREQLRSWREAGIQSVAVCLLHAVPRPDHELQVAALAREAGFNDICLSHKTAMASRVVPRAQTTTLDAYLDPVLRDYVRRLQQSLGDSELLLMTSSGSLVTTEQFTGKDSVLSGPAGGVVGCARAAEAAGFSQVIGFDMGGTSTDVCRYGGGFERQYESVKAGVRIVTPSLAIETVAAGGGSICHFDGLRLTVGPDSAGSLPGPACYGRGGPLTVTDVNFFLGRIPSPDLTAALFPDLSFPIPLQLAPVEQRLDALIERIAAATGKQYGRHELCSGLLQIANANMARAAKSISVDRGYDPAHHVLVAFGGAAAQHACAVATQLGVRQVLVHPAAGLLSAYGIGHSQLGAHRSAPAGELLSRTILELEDATAQELLDQGAAAESIESFHRVDACYQGLDSPLTLEAEPLSTIRERYEEEHERHYGFRQSRPVEIVTARVESRTRSAAIVSCPPTAATAVRAAGRAEMHDGQRTMSAALFQRSQLPAGASFAGPAIVLDDGSTTVVEPGWRAELQSNGDLLLSLEESVRPAAELEAERQAAESLERPDPMLLELFNNQFAGIAEQMGITLRNTSSSVNVKERLDFSCAIFTPEGHLVVNAPHIPVHLGAMSQTVRCVIEDTPNLHPGDVIVTNDPYRGGSHLPDVTVVLPVFSDSDSERASGPGRLLFFTASRAHHAEIGGITPGSMPPASTCLRDEGVLIRNFKLIDGGVSRFPELRQLLGSGPYPSRKPDENLADLAAQVAACRQGANELLAMCLQHGVPMVHAYMRHMQLAAEQKVRARLRQLGDFQALRVDQLDNGAEIRLKLNVSDGRATLDFAGTSPVLPSNLNANAAIVSAAVMYCMRCLLDEDIPLNEGVLAPIDIRLPPCLLNPQPAADPADCPAVVGGNVETSQRVVDVLLGALGVAAASQGTMNNLTFGDASFGYYETICGGAGATAAGPGADAVHTHMTNTRLTDPEVFEARRPVRLLEFSIRRGSHGKGKHRGGDGIVRRIEFLKSLTVSLLTQRRKTAPFGLAGGSDAQPGRNWIKRVGHTDYEPLAGCCQFQVDAGDELKLETPGGGGFGSPDEA